MSRWKKFRCKEIFILERLENRTCSLVGSMTSEYGNRFPIVYTRRKLTYEWIINHETMAGQTARSTLGSSCWTRTSTWNLPINHGSCARAPNSVRVRSSINKIHHRTHHRRTHEIRLRCDWRSRLDAWQEGSLTFFKVSEPSAFKKNYFDNSSLIRGSSSPEDP